MFSHAERAPSRETSPSLLTQRLIFGNDSSFSFSTRERSKKHKECSSRCSWRAGLEKSITLLETLELLTAVLAQRRRSSRLVHGHVVLGVQRPQPGAAAFQFTILLVRVRGHLRRRRPADTHSFEVCLCVCISSGFPRTCFTSCESTSLQRTSSLQNCHSSSGNISPQVSLSLSEQALDTSGKDPDPDVTVTKAYELFGPRWLPGRPVDAVRQCERERERERESWCVPRGLSAYRFQSSTRTMRGILKSRRPCFVRSNHLRSASRTRLHHFAKSNGTLQVSARVAAVVALPSRLGVTLTAPTRDISVGFGEWTRAHVAYEGPEREREGGIERKRESLNARAIGGGFPERDQSLPISERDSKLSSPRCSSLAHQKKQKKHETCESRY